MWVKNLGSYQKSFVRKDLQKNKILFVIDRHNVSGYAPTSDITTVNNQEPDDGQVVCPEKERPEDPKRRPGPDLAFNNPGTSFFFNFENYKWVGTRII